MGNQITNSFLDEWASSIANEMLLQQIDCNRISKKAFIIFRLSQC
jgi:hypothetical protein